MVGLGLGLLHDEYEGQKKSLSFSTATQSRMFTVYSRVKFSHVSFVLLDDE